MIFRASNPQHGLAEVATLMLGVAIGYFVAITSAESDRRSEDIRNLESERDLAERQFLPDGSELSLGYQGWWTLLVLVCWAADCLIDQSWPTIEGLWRALAVLGAFYWIIALPLGTHRRSVEVERRLWQLRAQASKHKAESAP